VYPDEQTSPQKGVNGSEGREGRLCLCKKEEQELASIAVVWWGMQYVRGNTLKRLGSKSSKKAGGVKKGEDGRA